MYKSYKLLTLLVSVGGGESETVEHLYKEVKIEGVATLVPCTEEESLLKFYKQMSTTGGNDKVQQIKCFLINPKGDIIKVEELIKPQTATE